MKGKRSESIGILSNVKGQGLSVNAIILIILGLVVLVILILGFTVGWNKIFPFINSNNVQNVVTACEAACTTGAQFDFCSVARDVNDGVIDSFKATCDQLSDPENPDRAKYVQYGVDACPAVDCSS